MRTSFLAFTAFALLASTITAASAFNYVDLAPRAVVASVVTDDNAYLAIAEHDYGCYTEIDPTSGKIDVNFDGGNACGAGGGQGINGYSTYYFHDVLKITNKGTAPIARIWLNMTAASPITIQVATAEDTMTTDGTYAVQKTHDNLAVGSSIYIGFKIDSYASGTATISKELTVQARNSV